MANTFALILVIATLFTGIVWCVERFKWAPARKAKIAAIKAQTTGAVDENVLAKAAKQPGWIETSASVFPVLALVLIIRSFVYEPFQIPSGSMMPTLLIGDFILVEKYAYGLKDPITQTTLIATGKPKRGDVAVFKYPPQPSVDYIKRVIGLPGDKITYHPFTKQITVQPACESGQNCEQTLVVAYDAGVESDWVQTLNFTNETEASSGFYQIPPGTPTSMSGFRLRQNNESLGAVTHRILTVPDSQDRSSQYYQQPGQPENTWVVPAGQYFMMGDNRDNSADSRYWGFVPEKNLVGKASFIWMSFEKQEGQWPTGIRFSHIGRIH